MINTVPLHNNLASTLMHLRTPEVSVVAVSRDSKISVLLSELAEDNLIFSVSYLAHLAEVDLVVPDSQSHYEGQILRPPSE
jgi:hypothetical protein